jgi:hypothetical protein
MTNEDRLIHEQDAGVGFEVDTRCFLHDGEPFDCDVCLIAETEAY